VGQVATCYLQRNCSSVFIFLQQSRPAKQRLEYVQRRLLMIQDKIFQILREVLPIVF